MNGNTISWHQVQNLQPNPEAKKLKPQVCMRQDECCSREAHCGRKKKRKKQRNTAWAGETLPASLEERSHIGIVKRVSLTDSERARGKLM
eukprot:1152873-Pelagomonas_calceolata.AAC.1